MKVDLGLATWPLPRSFSEQIDDFGFDGLQLICRFLFFYFFEIPNIKAKQVVDSFPSVPVVPVQTICKHSSAKSSGHRLPSNPNVEQRQISRHDIELGHVQGCRRNEMGLSIGGND